jgi:hypothetical protein
LSRRNLFIRSHWDLFDGFSSLKAPPQPIPKPGAAKKSKPKRRRGSSGGGCGVDDDTGLGQPPTLASGKPSFLHAGFGLREYQQVGVNWLLKAYHNGIGAILVM